MNIESIHVATEPGYDVRVGPGALESSLDWCRRHSRGAWLVDARVDELHGERLPAGWPRLVLPPGEERKRLSTAEQVLDFMADIGLHRASLLCTFGGGVFTDLGGLAASLFKRGIAVAHVPTTLLAQVDASVGGKTAVNLKAGKNLAGTFHQPIGVACDTELLGTLPEAEWRSGLGEVLKSALIAGMNDLARLEELAPAVVAREPEAVARVVRACVAMKASIVVADPEERGPRRVLNFGHTLGHGLETAAGHGALPHGVAIAVGMGLAFELARRTGVTRSAEAEERARALATRLDLPFSLAELREREPALVARLDPDSILAAVAQDKKGRVGEPEFVLPTGLGQFELGVRVGERELRALIGE